MADGSTTSWRPRIPFRPQLSIAADKVRRTVSRVDDTEVRKGRTLARKAREGGLDVVYFGDSTTSFVASYDEDRRPLHRMIRDMLGDDVTMHTIHGGSFSPPLFSTFTRLIEASGSRPVVIMPLCIRVRTTPWMEHPIHGRKNAIEFLSTVDPHAPLRRIRKGFRPPTPAEWSAFESLPHPSWAGDWTIGEYLSQLRQSSPTDDEWVKLLYAYHHGGRVPEGRTLDEVRHLGVELRRIGLPVVAYQTPVPVQRGEEFHPGFQQLAGENFTALADAFRDGYGRDTQILATGMVSGTEEFIDWRDASEHVNERGRLRLANSIVEATREQLSARASASI